jgi:hypothetical protein
MTHPRHFICSSEETETKRQSPERTESKRVLGGWVVTPCRYLIFFQAHPEDIVTGLDSMSEIGAIAAIIASLYREVRRRPKATTEICALGRRREESSSRDQLWGRPTV